MSQQEIVRRETALAKLLRSLLSRVDDDVQPGALAAIEGQIVDVILGMVPFNRCLGTAAPPGACRHEAEGSAARSCRGTPERQRNVRSAGSEGTKLDARLLRKLLFKPVAMLLERARKRRD